MFPVKGRRGFRWCDSARAGWAPRSCERDAAVSRQERRRLGTAALSIRRAGTRGRADAEVPHGLQVRDAANRTGGTALSTATILALPDVVPLDVTAAWQILGADLPRAGAPYQVRVCGEHPGLVPTRSGFGLHVDA